MKFKTLRTAAAVLLLSVAPAMAQDKLLNVSYDIARELFAALNPIFAEKHKAETGRDITIDQSHAGSSAQARAILEGLNADVVTFNQETDVDTLVKGGLVDENWREAFPNGASPFYSLPAFLVRKDNPKNIQDWDDLARDDVEPVFPNPRTSGNGRYTYLAAFAYALDQNGGDEEKAKEFVRKLLSNVPVFDTGGRAATQSFVERGIGDVLVTFEAETGGIAAQYEAEGLVRITPSVSLFAAFPVAVVTENTERNGSTEAATSYLNWLYSPEAQEVLAQHYYRVTDKDVAVKYAAQLPEVKLVTAEEAFGGWDKIREVHLSEDGILSQVFDN